MKKKLVVLSSLASGLVLAPLLVLAQNINPNNQVSGGCSANPSLTTIEGILCKIGSILNVIIPILIVLAVVYFIWGVVQYVVGGDEEKKKEGKSHMIYGIIGLVVIVAVWGLVSVVTNTFGLNGTVNVAVPTVPL